MAVRNFWIEASIDGRKEKLVGGPKNKIGGFDMDICQRVDGSVQRVVRIWGSSNEKGDLILYMLPLTEMEFTDNGLKFCSKR